MNYSVDLTSAPTQSDEVGSSMKVSGFFKKKMKKGSITGEACSSHVYDAQLVHYSHVGFKLKPISENFTQFKTVSF